MTLSSNFLSLGFPPARFSRFGPYSCGQHLAAFSAVITLVDFYGKTKLRCNSREIRDQPACLDRARPQCRQVAEFDTGENGPAQLPPGLRMGLALPFHYGMK